MSFDFNAPSSVLALQKPQKAIHQATPDASKLSLHTGEDAGQYASFMEAVNDLSQMFKFLPKYDQMNYQTGVPTDEALGQYGAVEGDIFGDYSKQMDPDKPEQLWGAGSGKGYSNIDYHPGASDWNLVEGVNAEDMSMFDEVNQFFDWDSISNVSGDKNYYDIAKSGDLSSYTDEQAFNLMCSMLESRERVFSTLHNIFGDPSTFNDDTLVIDHMTTWLESYTDVDPHNIGVLKMFFTMETDFINTVDAYTNCNTFWGGDLTNKVATSDLGSFSSDLLAKVNAFISSGSLSTEQTAAADHLKSLWTTESPRFDKSGDKYTAELIKTEGSWANFFWTKMDQANNQDIIRVIIANTMNRAADTKYKTDKKEYDDKVDQLKQDEAYLQKLEAKKKSSGKNAVKNVQKRSSVARAVKGGGASHIKQAPKPAPKPAVQAAASQAPARAPISVTPAAKGFAPSAAQKKASRKVI